MIDRALFVYKDVLCESVPEPPPGVTDEAVGDPTDSRRRQSELRTQSGTCGGCHGMFDHLAHAFEPYDFDGRYRELDEFSNPTRTDGVFVDPSGISHSYDNPSEFAALLVEDPRINPCLLRRIIRMAWGRTLTREDDCDVAEIEGRFVELGSTYEAAVLSIATHPSFSAKR